MSPDVPVYSLPWLGVLLLAAGVSTAVVVAVLGSLAVLLRAERRTGEDR